MVEFGTLFQEADWKSEKHSPVIMVEGQATAGKNIEIYVGVGREIAHPNTTAHHIAWIDLVFKPDGGKFPYHVGRYEFVAHGASTEGADTSTVYCQPECRITMKTEKSGELTAFSYCNIHGLWASKVRMEVE